MAEFTSPRPLPIRNSPFKTPPSSVRYQPYQLPLRRKTPRRIDFDGDSTPKRRPQSFNSGTYYNNDSFDTTPRKRPRPPMPLTPGSGIFADDESTPRKRPLHPFPPSSNSYPQVGSLYFYLVYLFSEYHSEEIATRTNATSPCFEPDRLHQAWSASESPFDRFEDLYYSS